MRESLIGKKVRSAHQNFIGTTIDFSKEVSGITFRIISSVLFGNDVIEKIPECNYFLKNGSIEKMSFSDYFAKIVYDCIMLGTSFWGLASTQIANLNIFEPYKTNHKNIMEMWVTTLTQTPIKTQKITHQVLLKE